ncbi:SDR family NAD(P)-dependent oxidoreductase [Streptomyces sp. M19]
MTGATMMTGYAGNAEANAESFTADGWFRTGDLAFVWDGGLVIAGREGPDHRQRANHFCHEIEAAAGSVPGWRRRPRRRAGCSTRRSAPTACWSSSYRGPDRRRAGRRGPGRLRPGRRGVGGAPGDGPRASGRRRGRRADRADAEPRGAAVRRGVPAHGVGKIQRTRLLASYTGGAFDARLRRLEVVDEGPMTLPPWFHVPAWEETRPYENDAPPGADGADRDPVLVFADDGRYGLLNGPPPARGRSVDRRPARAGRHAAAPGGRRLPARPDDENGYRALLAEIAREHPASAASCTPGHSPPRTPRTQRTPRIGRARRIRRARGPGGSRRGAAPRVLSVALLAGALADSRWPDAGCWSPPGSPTAPPRPGRTRRPGQRGPRRPGAQPGGRAGSGHDPAGGRGGRRGTGGSGRRGPRGTPPRRRVVRALRGRAAPRRRLAPVAVPDGSGPDAGFRPGGLYAVTGGLGGIGREVARHLATAYGARVLLLGRRDAAPEDLRTPAGAEGEIRYARVDVTDADALAEAVAGAERAWRQPLTGCCTSPGTPCGTSGTTSPPTRWRASRSARTGRRSRQGRRDTRRRPAAGQQAGRLAAALLVRQRQVRRYGFGAYAAASSFQDAFAAYWSRTRDRDVRALAWSQWAASA